MHHFVLLIKWRSVICGHKATKCQWQNWDSGFILNHATPGNDYLKLGVIMVIFIVFLLITERDDLHNL